MYGAERAFILTFRIGNAARAFARGFKHRAHEVAGTEHIAFQPAAIGGEILNRARGNAACHGSARHGGRHFQNQARIEGFRDDVIRPENRCLPAIGGGHYFGSLNARKCGNGIRCCDFHFFIDGGRTHIQRTAKDEGKAQNIIDLVWIIRPPRCHNRIRARGAHRFG